MTVQGTGYTLHFKMYFKICHRVFSLFACFSYFSAHDDILIRRPLRNLLHQVNFLHYDVMSWGNWHYSGPTILAPWWFWWLGMKMKLNIDEKKNSILTRNTTFWQEAYILMNTPIFWPKKYILMKQTTFRCEKLYFD